MLLDLSACRLRLSTREPSLLQPLRDAGPGWQPPPRRRGPHEADLLVTLSRLDAPLSRGEVEARATSRGLVAESALWRLDYRPAKRHAILQLAPESPPYRPGDAQRSGLRSLVAYHALWRRGAALHGALVAREGRGVLALGPGGAGKTTFARHFPWERVLADDFVVVRPYDRGYWGFGTPFRGREGQTGAPGRARLGAVVLLVQAPRTRAHPLTYPEAVAAVLARVHAPGGARPCRERALRFALALARAVPVLELEFSLGEDPWTLVGPMARTRCNAG